MTPPYLNFKVISSEGEKDREKKEVEEEENDEEGRGLQHWGGPIVGDDDGDGNGGDGSGGDGNRGDGEERKKSNRRPQRRLVSSCDDGREGRRTAATAVEAVTPTYGRKKISPPRSRSRSRSPARSRSRYRSDSLRAGSRADEPNLALVELGSLR
ncbi:serine/arginine-rich splicing factor RS40-like [Aristolochia californica]|uniref:serine/arginine-rich splicing factor RS40-like n=1 Tax=Aristolochia californica TaxID=171875 RepID=UPI0035D7AB96